MLEVDLREVQRGGFPLGVLERHGDALRDSIVVQVILLIFPFSSTEQRSGLFSQRMFFGRRTKLWISHRNVLIAPGDRIH